VSASRIALAAAALIAAASCYTPGRSLEPTGSAVENTRDLSGAWCFTSGSSREYRSGIGVLPFAPMYDVHEQSVITVRQNGNEIVFDYTARDGSQKQHTFDVAKADGTWDGGKLVIHPSFGANPFGIYHSAATATMYRLADGRLVMTDKRSDTGLACALVPYRETNEVVLSMRPAAGSGCVAAAGLVLFDGARRAGMSNANGAISSGE
jgi:hypothetical protein